MIKDELCREHRAVARQTKYNQTYFVHQIREPGGEWEDYYTKWVDLVNAIPPPSSDHLD